MQKWAKHIPVFKRFHESQYKSYGSKQVKHTEEAGHSRDSKKQWEIRSACDPKLLKYSIAVLFTNICLGIRLSLYSLMGSLVSNLWS